MFAVDFSADLTTALTGVTGAFTTNLGAIIPVTFGLAAIALVYRRVKGLIR